MLRVCPCGSAGDELAELPQSKSSAIGGISAQRNCFMLRSVVPRMRLKTSIWVVRTARTNSPNAAQFICLLSNVAVVNTVPVSLRHSNAATMSMSANDENAMDWPISRLPKCDLPSWMRRQQADRHGQADEPDGDDDGSGEHGLATRVAVSAP